MNLLRAEEKQNAVIQEARSRFHVSDHVIKTAVAFAGQRGHFIIKYDHLQEEFFLTDGEPYSLEAMSAF